MHPDHYAGLDDFQQARKDFVFRKVHEVELLASLGQMRDPVAAHSLHGTGQATPSLEELDETR